VLDDFFEWKHPLAGRRFGSLIVVPFMTQRVRRANEVFCNCDCGDEYIRVPLSVQRGRVIDCGSNVHKHTYALLAPSVSMVKIGCARCVADRVQQLQPVIPVPVVVIATHTRNIEGELHHRLAAHRTHGEWFRYDDEVSRVIRERMTLTGDTPPDVGIPTYGQTVQRTVR